MGRVAGSVIPFSIGNTHSHAVLALTIARLIRHPVCEVHYGVVLHPPDSDDILDDDDIMISAVKISVLIHPPPDALLGLVRST